MCQAYSPACIYADLSFNTLLQLFGRNIQCFSTNSMVSSKESWKNLSSIDHNLYGQARWCWFSVTLDDQCKSSLKVVNQDGNYLEYTIWVWSIDYFYQWGNHSHTSIFLLHYWLLSHLPCSQQACAQWAPPGLYQRKVLIFPWVAKRWNCGFGAVSFLWTAKLPQKNICSTGGQMP